MKVVTVLGARPQFIKAAPVSAVLRKAHTEILVHTGQHYDYQMSAIFFEEMGIPQPDYSLGVGSNSHGAQTGEMLAAIEQVLLREKPDWALVYGDTNSTLAGALAAVKLHIPVAHVEAGLRSYNRAMPEEINRVVTDHISALLFCPTDQAAVNLEKEGLVQGVVRTGDVMADALYFHARRVAEQRPDCRSRQEKQPPYILATIHRAENTDHAVRLARIFQAMGAISGRIILPLHPRTRKILAQSDIQVPANVEIREPAGYMDMIVLEKGAELILTDSGGVQKEAYLWRVPCVTLREETEWVETVQAGWNTLAGTDPQAIIQAVEHYRRRQLPPYVEALYGDGQASAAIVRALTERGELD
jgi:UDP-N-acetylglucosamine 2-epimerase